MIKFLHTRLKVANLEKSISFYEKLGFKCIKRTEKSPQGNELAFLELAGNDHLLELAYSKNVSPKVPEDLVHIALGVPDLIETCSELENMGITIWPENWKEKFKTENKMAFVTDPDGYEVELLLRK